MSTREIGNFLDRILGHSYSASTISQITDVVMEDVEVWQNRELQKHYSVGTYLKLRRDDVAIGLTEVGYRDI